MNLIKKIVAVVAVLAVALSVCACHPKNEVAYTIGDVEFTSAYYMCALINADLEAKSKVDEEKSAEETDTDETSTEDTSSEETDYYSEKIDGKKFVTYVKDAAVETLKEVAYYKSKCKENKLELEESTTSYAKSYVDYYWSQGYSSVFEPNGVSKSTFLEYTKDAGYKDLYFNFLYGEEGSKAISSEEVSKNLSENYCIADMLEADLSSKEDAEKTELTAMFESYEKDLKSGSRTFETIQNEYNEVTGNESSSSNSGAQDPYATILGAEGTNYENDNFSTVVAMPNNSVKLIKAEDGSKLTLLVKKEITADEYYLEQLDSTIRHALKDDEFDKDSAAAIKKLDAKENKSATKRFKVKEIEYPETSAS